MEVLLRIAHLPHSVFFDSACHLEEVGRYSFLAFDPFEWITAPVEGADGLRRVEETLAQYSQEAVEGLPPFQGGAAGLLGYELGRSFERLPRPRYDDFSTPSLAFGLYDVVIAFDHQQDRCWIISQGFPESTAARRRQRAAKRLAETLSLFDTQAPPTRGTAPTPLPEERLAPRHPVEGREDLTSSFSRAAYLDAVAGAVELIHAGDVFQVNLSQRLLTRQTAAPVECYQSLREKNGAPFAGYFDMGDAQICSASPERFLSVRSGVVQSRPIKGTRRRSADAAEDRKLAEELLANPKDRAENVMIVDLLRNDLSRVCNAESVRATTVCGLESYRHVHHLTSVIEGELAAGFGPFDLVRSAFPGGSITGAPKVRAMEIIAQLEPTARGPYCGSLAYVGFNGTMDSSILIRTLVISQGWVQASVGGGVVADSDPLAEYQETWHKAAGLI